MTNNTITMRTYPAGAAATGLAYSVLLELDSSSLQASTTDASGRFTYSANLNPGPFRWTVIDTSTEPDAVRVGSTKSSGSGGTYSFAEVPIALRILGPGVVPGYKNEMAGSYDGAGLDLDINTGALVNGQGIPAVVYSSIHHTVVSVRDATNPRQCYLVVETTGLGQTQEGKSVTKDVCGAAAASPSLPALTQDDTTWQEPIVSFRLPNTGSTTLTQVTDVRRFAGKNPLVAATAQRIDPATPVTGVVTTTGQDVVWTDGATGMTLLNGVTYDITMSGFLLVKAGAGQTISIAGYINGTGNIGTFLASNVSADYVAVPFTYKLLGVLGAGAAITNGLRVKVNGGSGAYNTGAVLIEAKPR